jgi:hypothetical protein
MCCPDFFKTITLSLLALILSLSLNAQDVSLLRSSLNTGGGSGAVSLRNRSCLVQQSIGQPGSIGLSSSGRYILRQGFLQPMQGLKVKKPAPSSPLQIYPNPFHSRINLRLPDTLTGELLISLNDMYGRLVYSTQESETGMLSIDLPALAPGLYLLRVNTGTHCNSSLLIKE